MIPTTFPHALLSQPAAVRLEYFNNLVVIHPYLKKAFDELMNATLQPQGQSVIFTVCCPGVGKRMLRDLIQNELTKIALADMQKDPGYIPVFAIEAIASANTHFNWRDFQIRCLRGLQEPLIEHKITDDKELIHKNSSSTTLYRALQQCIYHRRVRVFIVNEAHNLLKPLNNYGIQVQKDAITTLFSLNVVWILLGTYELQRLTGLSNKSRLIHFPRYHAESAEEVEMFKDVLRTFQYHLPVRNIPDLTDKWMFFYERSLGCTEILHDWFARSLRAALANNRLKLTLKYFEQTALPTARLCQIAREIVKEEKNFRTLINGFIL